MYYESQGVTALIVKNSEGSGLHGHIMTGYFIFLVIAFSILQHLEKRFEL